MNFIQKRLVNSYTVLVMADVMSIEEVPETKKIGAIEYPIKSEVEIEIARKTIEVLG